MERQGVMREFLDKTFDFSGNGMDLLDIFRDEPYVFLLDSSQQERYRGRYSFLGFDPFHVIRADGKDALHFLKREFLVYGEGASSVRGQSVTSEENSSRGRKELPPLIGGAVGFISYDYGLSQEGIPSSSKKDVLLPDILFGLYDCVLSIDHWEGKLRVISTGLPEKNGVLKEKRARDRLRYVLDKLSGYVNNPPGAYSGKMPGLLLDNADLGLQCHFSTEQYLRAVNKALEYIRRGDIYQVNLSRRFEFNPQGSLWEPRRVYRSLRHMSPTFFGGYFDAGDFQIISSSPERFVRVKKGVVQTQPMKGTIPRGENAGRDRDLKKALRLSRKDKAELLMITDLERNDLGRVCAYGTVRVKKMRAIESYRTVFQATATIEGVLRKDKDIFDLIRAAFPGGSITGCPKIRAMQIIEELEPTKRGLYTGCLGYIDFNGNMDFNILIRTVLAYQNKLYFQVGSGIVADSTPEKEDEEVLIKAKAIRLSLQDVFGRVEQCPPLLVRS